MVYIWNTNGQLDNLEQFTLGDMYSISILVVDPKTNSTIVTKMFPNVSSKQTPLVHLLSVDFNIQNVNVIIQDNTFYTTQSPLKLYLQFDQSQVPYLILFTSTQSLNNVTMRSATVLNIPYKNIIITFDNK